MDGYIIYHSHGCVLLALLPSNRGIPLSAFSELAKMMPKGAIVSAMLARVYRVSVVTGLPGDLRRLAEAEETKVQRRSLSAHLPAKATPEMRAWVENGDVGASSATIFYKMTGWHADPRMISTDDEPLDAGDLLRCVELLEAVPAFAPRLPEMATVSPYWKRLVDNWEALMKALQADGLGNRVPPLWEAPASRDRTRRTDVLLHSLMSEDVSGCT